MSRRQLRRSLWAPLLIYLALTLVMTWPLARQFTGAIPGDSFDGWQNFWNLWWLKVALVERVEWPLFTDLLFAPTGVSLNFHTLNPFNGLLAMPVLTAAGGAGAALYLSYNFIVLFSFTLSGYGAFLLACWALRPHALQSRPETGAAARWWAALTAGAIFAFAPVHMAHLLGHMQVFAYQWLPFAALALLRANEAAMKPGSAVWRREWLRPALWSALFFVLAALCDWYFALYLLLFALGAAGLRVVQAGAGRDWARTARVITANALAGGLALLLLAPLLGPMVREAAQNDYMLRPAADLYTYSATAVDFLIPSRMHALFRTVSPLWPGNQIAPISERTLAVGYGTLALALAGLLLVRRRAAGWLVAALIFALLALGPAPALFTVTAESVPAGAPLNEWSLYNLVNQLVPFMRISRSVGRFGLMVQMTLAVVAAFGLAALLERLGSRRVLRAAGAGALLVVLAEFWVAPFPMSPADTPPWYGTAEARVAEPGRAALLNLPMNYDRPGYLLYQTVHGRPLNVAYISRDDPRTLTERVPLLQHLRRLGPDIIEADLAAVGPTVLQDLGTGTVVLDRYKMPGGLERSYTEEVAQLLFGAASPRYEDERITVYAAPRVAGPAAYLRLGYPGWGPLQGTEAGEAIGREITVLGAAVEVLHGSGEEMLEISWRGTSALRVESADGVLLARAVAQPGGGVTSVRVPGESLILRAEEATLLIEGLALSR